MARMELDELVELETMPEIDGLVFRRYRGAEDAAALAQVKEAGAKKDRIDPLSSVESLPDAETIKEALRYKDPLDTLLAEVNGQIVAFAYMLWWTEDTGVWVYQVNFSIMPDWRGHKIGEALLDWAENRSRELAEVHPTGGRVLVAANATNAEKDAVKLLKQQGYTPRFRLDEYRFDRFRSLNDREVPVPESFTIKPIEVEHYQEIWKAHTDAFGHDSSGDIRTKEDYRKLFESPDFDQDLWRVAWVGKQVAGIIECTVDERRGELADLCVRPSWRRNGLAKALVNEALKALREKGIKHLYVNTRSDNRFGAGEMYKNLGFKLRKVFTRFVKPLQN